MKSSVNTMDPMNGIKKEWREEFKGFLDKEEKLKLDQAYNFYNTVLTPDAEELFRKYLLDEVRRRVPRKKEDNRNRRR